MLFRSGLASATSEVAERSISLATSELATDVASERGLATSDLETEATSLLVRLGLGASDFDTGSLRTSVTAS